MTSREEEDNQKEGDFLDQDGKERRTYVRVEDTLPVLCRVLKEQEWDQHDPSVWFRKVWNQYPLLDTLSLIPWEPDSRESIQAYLLMELHRKLDLLADLLQDKSQVPLQRPVEQKISLSASGVRIVLDEFCRLGDRVALYVVLPEVPPVNLFVTGEVIRVSDSPGKIGYETAINFISLSVADQDRLIKYIFRKLRNELRESRNAAAPPLSS